MKKNEKVPSDQKSRNKILQENKQKFVFIKRINNNHNTNENKPVFLERIVRKYFSTYIKLTHKDVVKRSNIAEISNKSGKTLWRINNKNNKKN